MHYLKLILKRTPVFTVTRNIRNKRRAINQWREWVRKGRPLPPTHGVKQLAIRYYARKFGIRTLIETGTYRGDMLDATKEAFSRLVSIEFYPPLYEAACRRFAQDKHITLYQGDSGVVLPKIVKELSEPSLFWLDGHYSGDGTGRADLDTPIIQELQAILSHECPKHVILIDDARLFVGKDDYPTIESLNEFVQQIRPGWTLKIHNDIIRIHSPIS